MTATTKCFSAITGSRIDREKGVIYGVSAITVGVAKGHEVYIDRATLETVKQVASEFSEGIKVKFRHGKTGEFQSVLEETVGLLKNFVIDGDKVRGDLHLLKSLAPEVKEKAFEMAETMPSQFGLSIVFCGVNETIGGKKFLRCHELQSIDLTDKPAANPDGLFSMSKEIKYETGTSGKHSKDCLCGECETKGKEKSFAELSGEIASLAAIVTGLVKRLDAAPAVGALTAKDGKSISADDILVRLEAADKFVADAKKTVEASERATVIGQLSAEGRVVMNPETNVAYKLEELQKLDLPLLKFAAKNSPVLPTVAKSVFTSAGNGPDKTFVDASGKKLTGSALTSASWEADYGDLEKMITAPVGSTTAN